MSTRLNTHLRTRIVDNAVTKAGIDAAQAAVEVDFNAWADELRVFLNGVPDSTLLAAEKKALKAVRELPKHMIGSDPTLLCRQSWFNVNLAGANIQPNLLDANGDHEERIVPRGRQAVLADNPLVQRFYDIEARKKEVADKRTILRAQVKAAIASVTTVASLLKTWPEAKELLPANIEEAKSQLPALAVVDLNALIGLPTEQAA